MDDKENKEQREKYELAQTASLMNNDSNNEPENSASDEENKDFDRAMEANNAELEEELKNQENTEASDEEKDKNHGDNPEEQNLSKSEDAGSSEKPKEKNLSTNEENIPIPEKISVKILYIEIAKTAARLEKQQEYFEQIIEAIYERNSLETEAIQKLLEEHQKLLDEHKKQLEEMEKALFLKTENAMAVMDQAELEMRQVQRRNAMLANFYPSWQPYHEDMQEYINRAMTYISAEAKNQSHIYIDEVRKQGDMYLEAIVKEHKNALEALGQRYAEEIKKFQGVSVKLPKITIEQMIIPTAVSFVGMIIVMALSKLF